MANKHFIVTSKDGQKRLIQAKTKGAALGYVVGTEYSCEVAKTADAVQFLQNGGVVENADTGETTETILPLKDARQTEIET